MGPLNSFYLERTTFFDLGKCWYSGMQPYCTCIYTSDHLTVYLPNANILQDQKMLWTDVYDTSTRFIYIQDTLYFIFQIRASRGYDTTLIYIFVYYLRLSMFTIYVYLCLLSTSIHIYVYLCLLSTSIYVYYLRLSIKMKRRR